MVNALRCGMESTKTSIQFNLDPAARLGFETFLYKLQVWQSLATTAASNTTTMPEDVYMTLLKIQTDAPVPCDYMLYPDDHSVLHTGFCPNMSEDGLIRWLPM
jgi:hypothetical protein